MFSTVLASERTIALQQTATDSIDAPRQPLFTTNLASDALLHSFKVNGSTPARKVWNFQDATDRLAATSTCSFGLKTLENRDWRLARSDMKKRTKGIDPLAPDPPDISKARASLVVSNANPTYLESLQALEEKPMKRADKYYQALLKAERARQEYFRRTEWEEYCAKATKASEKARKQGLKAEKADEEGRIRSDSESEEEEEEEEEEDPGPMKPYPGVMKVEVEVVVLRAPGADRSETESSVDQHSTHTPSSASNKSEDDDEGIDWNKELQALQEELGSEESKVESEVESEPDDLYAQKIGNIHDATNKRTALGLGGTAFFVPEVERYALAPSLLPPPPRGEGYVSQIGKKRMKLKPRLPLEVSKHRWRDEHPYGCPAENEFTPDVDDVRSWETSVRKVELYGTLNKLITEMPKPDGIRKLPRTDDFERSLDKELEGSLAWKQYIKRQRLIEVARAQRDAAEGVQQGVDIQSLMQDQGKHGVETQNSSVFERQSKVLDYRPISTKEERIKRGKKSKPTLVPTRIRVPPLTIAGSPSFKVGQVIGKGSHNSSVQSRGKSSPAASRTKSSPPSSPPDSLPPRSQSTSLMSMAPGSKHQSAPSPPQDSLPLRSQSTSLMSVAPGIRHGADK